MCNLKLEIEDIHYAEIHMNMHTLSQRVLDNYQSVSENDAHYPQVMKCPVVIIKI